MGLSDELAYLDATEIALRIRRRQLSPVDVVAAFIARIEARNPTINAFVYRGFDEARAKAKDAEISTHRWAAAGAVARSPSRH